MGKDIGAKFTCDRCGEEKFISAKDIYGDDWADVNSRELANASFKRIKTEQNWVEMVANSELTLLCDQCYAKYVRTFTNFISETRVKLRRDDS